MNLTRFSLANRTFVLSVVTALLIAGAMTFTTMSRREDPEITIRAALITTRWPGATARKVEDLVTDPLETAIKKMDGVDEITSESRTGLSIITVELDETISHVDQYWDELRAKVAQVEPDLPSGARKPNVDSDFGDVSVIVLALWQAKPPGSAEHEKEYSYRELEVMGEGVVDDLKNLPQVAKVDLLGVQDERIYLEVDPADWAKISLPTSRLQSLLESRNIVASGGEVNRGGSRLTMKPTGEFSSVDQIEEVLVGFGDGDVPIRLGDLPVEVVRDYVDPMTAHFHFVTPDERTERCLLVAIAMKEGQNIVELGRIVGERVGRLQEKVLPPDIRLSRINDLPAQVDGLVRGFVTNLWQAIVIVLAVALVMMGWRPALIMATAVPLCMIVAILVVSLLGVELEQFSIASLIIALGMLVDNAIVVSDNALREIEERKATEGKAKEQAVTAGAWDLWKPILTSTATTVAAFVPMLTIVGNVGEYTRSLPIVVATTLGISFFVAMMVTPLMCLWLLKPKLAEAEPHAGIVGRVTAAAAGLYYKVRKKPQPAPRPAGAAGGTYDRMIRWCLRHELITIGGAALAVVLSLQLVPFIGSQFFPGGVRNQFFVHVWLPEGASIAATKAKVREVESILLETSKLERGGESVERLKSCTSFVGTGGPRLNLTTNPEQQLTNYAHLLVNTTDDLLSAAWADEVRARTDQIPGARIDVRAFRLGPYIENPVEFRLGGEDHAVLREKAEQIIEAFRETPGTYNPFHNWYNDGYVYEVDIDEEKANLARVTNQSVAQTMDTMISGGYLTTFREGDHSVPVMLRVKKDLRESILESVDQLYVDGQTQKVPLEAVATLVAGWEPACIVRRDTVRTVSIGSQCRPGFLSNSVAAAVRPKIDAIVADLPATYAVEAGGELEQTRESQAKLVRAFSIAAALILLVLIAQYDSVIKPLIVLATVPLALIGALLGLFVTGWPIGFMPSLGIISLAGVVINNAIILIDFIEGNIRGGQPLEDAVASAGRQRMRPIVLTTLTTVGGLLPLALFGGPMWAGMSWAMIFGLSLSTGLTLLVVPTIYAFCFERFGLRVA